MRLSPIPRYLFRLFTPFSVGNTDETWVKSRDAAAGCETAIKDIFETSDRSETAKLIADHLWWRPGERKSNLVSWTSSLLFAIQYVFYRHASPLDIRRAKDSDMSNIKICVVDTTMLERAFIRDLDLIEAFQEDCTATCTATCEANCAEHKGLYRLQSLRTRGGYYFGEYLSQGRLKVEGECRIISAEAMIELGLLSLQAEFRGAYHNERCGWVNEVRRVRNTFQEEGTPTLDPEQIEVAIRIAQLFGPRWRMPVAISLVALLPGCIVPNDVRAAFGGQAHFDGAISPSESTPWSNMC